MKTGLSSMASDCDLRCPKIMESDTYIPLPDHIPACMGYDPGTFLIHLEVLDANKT